MTSPCVARLASRCIRTLLAALFLAAPLVVLVGCGGEVEPRSDSNKTAPLTDDEFPLTVTDVLGRKVTLNAPPRRIVSLAPRNTEILFALGAGERLIGVTSYCNYPPEAAQIEVVGGFSGPTVNLEKLVALRPDLVLTAGNLHEPLIARLENLGMTVVALYAESFDELASELTLVGQFLSKRREANHLADELRRRFAAVKKTADSIPAGERRRVMYLVADEPLMAAGTRSFIGQLIDNCGAENVFSDVAQAYPQISEEAVLARDPEVLLAPSSFDRPEFKAGLLARPAWKNLTAIREGRIVYLDEDLLSRCGPRSADAQEAVAEAIYPDRFAHDEPPAASESDPP